MASAPNPVDPLAQLHDIQLPVAIDAWPPAVGWWIISLLGIGILGYLGFLSLRHWRKNQYRREAIADLQKLLHSYHEDTASINYLALYNNLLKRVAMSHFRRDQVASLSGEAWVAFLDNSGNTQEFSMGSGQSLIQGNYAPASDFDAKELHKIGYAWIKNHHSDHIPVVPPA